MPAESRLGTLEALALVASLAVAPWAAAADDLLSASRGGTSMWSYCEGKPDAAPIPADPRSRVSPGANAGKAVHYNTRWRNCHFDPEAVGERGPAETCGDLRARHQAGQVLMDPGSAGPAGLFTGTDPDDFERLTSFTAEQYNLLWTVWGGFVARPENFDELAAERYGSAFSGGPNPYPLPGEDPNQTGGGSGTLPEAFTQLRDGAGNAWSGELTLTCHACHSGAVGVAGGPGPGLVWGGGSSLADLDLILHDLLQVGWETSAIGAGLSHLNRTRGRSNAAFFELPWASMGAHGFDDLPQLLGAGSAGDMEAPAWWNMGHRPSKFIDGVFPMDTPRWDTIFFAPYIGLAPEGEAWMREHSPDVNVWVESLEAPAYPLPVDTALAEAGAVLFHRKDLWKNGNEHIPRPEGNGSCASCHGVYAPRYTNDPEYLDSPELAGVAGYTVPIAIIGTDPARLESHEDLQEAARGGFFSYPSTAGTPQDCGPQNHPDLAEGRAPGYLAPPLYGVWATAPYLHNGSVPNLWEVLKPSDRVQIWRRWSKPRIDPAFPNELGNVVMGFDTDLERAFDPVKVGWRYDEIACQIAAPPNPSVSPYLSCNPDPEDPDTPLLEAILAELYSGTLLGWNALGPSAWTPAQIEERKIYNTKMFSNGNEGHEFTAVLSDAERLALIEYLKTL